MTQASASGRTLVIAGSAGALLALVIPPLFVVGLACGILLLVRTRVAPGVLLVTLSCVAGAIGWSVVMPEVFMKPYRAPSESMFPTIEAGDRFLVNRLASPDVGDIVVFNAPAGAASVDGTGVCGEDVPADQLCARPVAEKSDVSFVKRVVAGPGDRLRIRGGKVIRDGEPADEPFAAPCGTGGGCDYSGEITIPEGHYYMLGDNRGQSLDSRFWGPVPEDWIIGGAFAKYWPPGEIGGI